MNLRLLTITRVALALCLMGLDTIALADSAIFELGTWVQRGAASPLVLTIEMAGSGRKLTYRALRPDARPESKFVLTVETQLDGKDAPTILNGQPTNETMAIKRLDALHAVTVLRRQGKEYGSNKAELSPDGKVMKVEQSILGAEKKVEYWDKK